MTRPRPCPEIKRIAGWIEQIIYDDASWVNSGPALLPLRLRPLHQVAPGFNVAQSRYAYEFMVHWIDQDEKAAVTAARRNGPSLVQILNFNQSRITLPPPFVSDSAATPPVLEVRDLVTTSIPTPAGSPPWTA